MRFLLRQGEDSKIRIIDDFKMSAVSQSGFRLLVFLGIAGHRLRRGTFEVSLTSASRSIQGPRFGLRFWMGDWSPEMRNRPDLLGKTLDEQSGGDPSIHQGACCTRVPGSRREVGVLLSQKPSVWSRSQRVRLQQDRPLHPARGCPVLCRCH